MYLFHPHKLIRTLCPCRKLTVLFNLFIFLLISSLNLLQNPSLQLTHPFKQLEISKTPTFKYDCIDSAIHTIKDTKPFSHILKIPYTRKKLSTFLIKSLKKEPLHNTACFHILYKLEPLRKPFKNQLKKEIAIKKLPNTFLLDKTPTYLSKFKDINFFSVLFDSPLEHFKEDEPSDEDEDHKIESQFNNLSLDEDKDTSEYESESESRHERESYSNTFEPYKEEMSNKKKLNLPKLPPYDHSEKNSTSDPSFYLKLDLPRDHQTSFYKDLSSNSYLNLVIKYSPNELVEKFLKTAPYRVQEAVKTTIMGLIGTFTKFSLETTILTTGEKMSNLLFQLLITGYMFKNAEYRLSLSESLKQALNGESKGSMDNSEENVGIKTTHEPNFENISSTPQHTNQNTSLYKSQIFESTHLPNHTNSQSKNHPNLNIPSNMQIDGMVTLKTSDGKLIKTTAALLISELRKRILSLKRDIQTLKLSNQNKKADDLLGFIKSLPEAQMLSLTENISEEILDAMRKLTKIVVEGLGVNRENGNDSITQQTGSVLAQLCMWQLVVGYNLRDLEVREDIRKSMHDL